MSTMKLHWIALGLGIGLAPIRLAAQTPALPEIVNVPPQAPYRWRNVVIRGGGFVSGLVFSTAQKGLVYARTDVGGAYRSDNAGESWIPLTDQFGRDEASLLGIESVALDPNDPDRLYLAAGMYSADWGGPAAMLLSQDRGKTFRKIPMPFKMGGNDNGRGCGERLAVDPNLGSILYFGSRKAGLWKSADTGVTWSHVDSFPVQAKVTGVGENTGITFVAFDSSTGTKGNATKTIYAGAAQAGAALYRSVDAGATWELMPGAPKGLFPNHAAVNPGKAIYFSFVDNVGPNGIQDGAIEKFTPGDGKWKDITPIRPGAEGTGKFGYGGLSIDYAHPDTVIVTTIDRWNPSDAIFRSVDGGKKWKDVTASAQYSATSTPWVYWHHATTGGKGWMSDIKIDPFNPDKVMYTTGEGIWGSADLTALDAGKPTHWGFPNEGLEETVPLAIVSPSAGTHLISAVGDIAGFRHEDITKSPQDGFYVNPLLYTNSSLDVAALAPLVVVRVGHGDGKTTRGGYSQDNGTTWKPFGSEPPSSEKGGGTVAISADGRTVVWSPQKGAPYWTSDWGSHWTACGGLNEKMRVVADRMNPARFYSFNPDTGQLLLSADKARNFSPREEVLAQKAGSAVIAATPGADGDVWIAVAGKVYHTTDAGASFAVLQGMEKVSTIGFGMASPEGRPPAIFMNGSVAKTEGIFRSDDSGKTWVRVDDPRHQFGWKNAMAGDPRVFGRVYLATGGRGIVYGEPAASAQGSGLAGSH
jgi:hypothetical protein